MDADHDQVLRPLHQANVRQPLPDPGRVSAGLSTAGAARADEPRGFLETVKKHVTLTSTVTDNGDQNPYALVVAPVSAGKIQKDDVLVDNFNDLSNLQGPGTTIVDYNPATKTDDAVRQAAAPPAAMPGRRRPDHRDDDAEKRLGHRRQHAQQRWHHPHQGATAACWCSIPTATWWTTWTGPDINGPWGNMAVVDNGATATLFVSMAGFDVPGPQVRDPATGYSGHAQQGDGAADRSCRFRRASRR